MEFRDLKRQYSYCEEKIKMAIAEVMQNADFISGREVVELEERLAKYVGRKYCISCGNGTDALQMALMALGVGEGDAVFVPDFTFFSTAEVVSLCGAIPVFVDILEDTFNMNPESLEKAIIEVKAKEKLNPKLIIPVDLFGLPANYKEIKSIAARYGMYVLEDGAQGFGGRIGSKKACSFGEVSTTSFFPAKPLGCYGDGGAVFTDDEEIAELLRSLRVHGKGRDKYDNVRIGMNSRLDTIQAAILLIKLEIFDQEELVCVNKVADKYTNGLKDKVKVPFIPDGYYSSWAQYSIMLRDSTQRDGLKKYLHELGIPSMIYYKKPMHLQGAFNKKNSLYFSCSVTESVCNRILALPMHPYMKDEEISMVIDGIRKYIYSEKE